MTKVIKSRKGAVSVKVVGYYSDLTKHTYTRKSDRNRAENKFR